MRLSGQRNNHVEQTMTARNVLFIISDQHQQKATGCYGHPFVKTPNIDKLAAAGTRFTTAYTNSAICVPSRAAIATGRYVHDTGCWDNAHPYIGQAKSWHHMLRENGLSATSIGKLHFRNETDPTGFIEQVAPMHIVDGIGDVRSCIKRPMSPPFQASKTASRIGPGESPYTEYDREIATLTGDWLKAKADGGDGKPWALFCSFVCPHPPHIAPPEFYEMYPTDSLPVPKLSEPDSPVHPWIHLQERNRNHNDFLTDETRRILMASYYGCISYLDQNIGRVLDALADSGLADDTIVVYTTDHGENLGTRRLWGKSNMYEEACALPMIVAGPDVPAGKVCRTPVTQVDIAPTILDATGLGYVAAAEGLPGRSMLELAQAGDDPDRVAFSEYYAAAADRAAFMIRKGRYKYIHYAGYDAELFDLETDPEELNNIAADPAHRAVAAEYEAILRSMVDPEALDEQTYREQTALVEKHGGRDALITKGAFQGTPAPGDDPEYVT
jgi:choline-sulfatase